MRTLFIVSLFNFFGVNRDEGENIGKLSFLGVFL